MPRLSNVPMADWDQDLRALSGGDKIPEVSHSMTRILAHHPAVAKTFVTYMTSLDKSRTLPRRLIELVRLRIAFHNQCRPCMSVRYPDDAGNALETETVCSLEKPYEADDLSDAEKAALRYADLFATNHLAIDDKMYAELKRWFSEAEIIELSVQVSAFVAAGRLAATWAITEHLPEKFAEHTGEKFGPWDVSGIPVAGARMKARA